MGFSQSIRWTIRRFWPFILLFLGAQFFVRLALALYSFEDLSASPVDWLLPFLLGFLIDLATLLPVVAVVMVFPLLLPVSWAGGRLDRSVGLFFFALSVLALLLAGVGEFLFWDEFTTRFNFIAVDYLVYTQEVLSNIMESYPVKSLFALLVAVAVGVTFALRRKVVSGFAPHPPFHHRLVLWLATCAAAAIAIFLPLDRLLAPINNAIARELAGNGERSFVSAFFNNEISFSTFYATLPDEEVEQRTRALLVEEDEPFESKDPGDITRIISASGPMLRKNVILVSMESMSASFMGVFGEPNGLTPNLDRLAGEGLFFANMRATGTRTVRGLEALSLSVPPTPGQSILRRPGNENLFTIGTVFQDQGYDTRFIYGGYGYFDNMNAFFAGNGFETVDRANMAPENVHFTNAWGVSDEDLFDEVVRRGDASYAAGHPFFDLVMTTSNHRPFTYPDGKIDIPSPGGRNGAVKYSDYAVGQLVKEASEKPWFKDTIFVFVADHTASVAGKAELDPDKYHIPCIVWSPGFIQPKRIDQLVSQIDVAPTVLDLVHASYRSRFFGDDMAKPDEQQRPVFISNYEKVAMLDGDRATILEPKRRIVQLLAGKVVEGSEIDENAVKNAIALYQFASRWRTISQRIATALD